MKNYLSILKLVWPLSLGMINNAAMQFVDRVFLAKHSEEALMAVLPAMTLAWIFLGFFQAVVGYAGVFVSQFHGAGDEARCRESYRAGLWIALVSGILMLPLTVTGNVILGWTADPGLLALERSYFDIILLGGVFVYGQMAASSYFTGRGRTRTVFWVNVLGNLLNIALDPILIFGWCGCPRLGMAGAAYATVFSLAVQFVTLVLMTGDRSLRTSWDLVRRILRYGIPSGGYEILNMLSFTIFVFVTQAVGGVAFAVSNACFTVNYLVYAPMMGFAIGAQTLVGQARGRGDDREAQLALRRTMILGLAVAVVVCVSVLALHRPILSLFAPSDPSERAAFLSLGAKLFCVMAAWLLFDSADVILSGALKGAGDTKFVFWWMLFCAFVLWLPLVFVAWHFGDSMVELWLTMVVYVVVISVGSILRWRCGRWRAIRLTGKTA